MKKRYQVFVSSTYVDLLEERAAVMQTLLEMDCMPAGMELFPAASQSQLEWIKRVIDESDYYLLILGDRYGSIEETSGLSYTEIEYRHAVQSGKPVIGFLKSRPRGAPPAETDEPEEHRRKLETFRSLVATRLCDFWKGPADLARVVAKSLHHLMQKEPAVGWIRLDQLAAAARELLPRDTETFARRQDAYAALRPRLEGCETQRIDLLQFSGATALDLLGAIARSQPGAHTRLLLAHPEQTLQFDTGGQVKHSRRIERTLEEIQLLREETPEGSFTIEVGFYATPSSVAAVIVDDRLVNVGWYRVFPHGPERELRLRGHDAPAVTALGDAARPWLRFARSHFEALWAAREPVPL
ncbi:MAG TPA: DUF4062 domain-containing protein [Longimicrobium sp.]|nr:DUF4062 domain-containing protein [Longimicrobium sp.]